MEQHQQHQSQYPEPPRRTFLKWVVHGISAVFAVVLGAPVVAYLLDPLNRPRSASGFRTVDGLRLGHRVAGDWVWDIQVGQPQQGVIRNVRRDAWTLYPNDVVGRVWVVMHSEPNAQELQQLARQMDGEEAKLVEADKIADPDARLAKVKSIEEAQAKIDAALQAKIGVYTTVCPHLGCAINMTPPSGFTCPCHGAKFNLKGELEDKASNPAPRGMDSLKWMVDLDDPGILKVKYVNFYQGREEKVPKT